MYINNNTTISISFTVKVSAIFSIELFVVSTILDVILTSLVTLSSFVKVPFSKL